MSYAADELSRQGVVSTKVEAKLPSYIPNFTEVPGLWKSYDIRFKRIVFAWVQLTPGLPDGNLCVRRYLSVKGLTDDLYYKYKKSVKGLTDKKFTQLTMDDKRCVAERIMKCWCDAILNGTEDAFIEDHQLPRDSRVRPPTPACDPSPPAPAVTLADTSNEVSDTESNECEVDKADAVSLGGTSSSSHRMGTDSDDEESEDNDYSHITNAD